MDLRRNLILIYLIIYPLYFYAQEVKMVIYEDGENIAIPNVICKIFNEKDELIDFSTSNNNGEITINHESAVLVSLNLLGYEKLSLRYNDLSRSTVNKVFLKPSVQLLNEIVVKAPPIRQKNDTLIYNVASFASTQDKYIEDILKKLPGINVGENGRISYQGKSISKFYIEGQDLLGSNYNQATKNLPIESVSQIELMENNQNIRALKDKVFEDKAALNIKLNKDYKIKPFGEIQLGGGIKPNVYENKMFITQIGNKNQLLVTAKMNNFGTDLSNEVKEHIDISNIDFYEPLPSTILRTSLFSILSLPKEKVLFNKSYSWGVNNLIKINDVSNFRINLMGYIDRSNQNTEYEYKYGGDAPFDLNEKNKIKDYTQTYVPILTYELNSNHLYISNESRGSFSILNQDRYMASNDERINQEIKNKPTYFQNSLSISYPRSVLIYQLKSFVRYYYNHEKMSLLNMTNDNMNNSELQYKTKNILTKNKVSTTLPLGKHSFDFNLLFNYKKNNWDLGDYNNLGYTKSINQELSAAFSPGLSYKYSEKGRFKIDVPIAYNKVNINPAGTSNTESGYVTIAPNFTINQEFNQYLSVKGLLAINKYNESDIFYSATPYWLDYRTLYYGFDEIYARKTFRSSISVNYKHLASMFFCNFTVSYNSTNKSYLRDYIYKSDYTQIKPVPYKNTSKLLYTNFTADKTFINIGLSLKLSLDYNSYNYWLMQNGVATNNKSNTLSSSMNIIYQQIKWLKMVANINGNLNWQNNNYLSSTTTNLSGDISLFVIPHKKLSINLTHNSYINEVQPDQFKYFNLMNAEVQYSVLKQVNLNFKLHNILNNRTYSISYYNGLNFQSRVLPVRGREYLFSISYKI